MSEPTTPAGRRLRRMREMTGRQIVADLEELAMAGAIDTVAVGMIREGLAAIADRIHELHGNGSSGGPLVLREDVLRLVDPKPPGTT